MEFTHHSFMIDILDNEQNIVVQKCAQIGMSTCEIFRILHKVSQISGITWIYVLPTETDVRDFAGVKTRAIIQQNPNLPFKKTSARERLETLSNPPSFILFKGTWTEREAIMIDADGLTYDELDRCNFDVLTIFESRILNSKYKFFDKFSTPTFPEFGINEEFNETCQYHWFVKCSRCNYWQYLRFPESINFERKTRICIKCKRELRIEDLINGEWAARYPSRDKQGYWVSALIYPNYSVESIIRESEKPDKQYFYNFILGLPYRGSDVRVDESAVWKNYVKMDPPDTSRAVMGVDIGNVHHYVIGNEKGVFEIGEIEYDNKDPEKGFSRIIHLMEKNNVQVLVIDAMPDINHTRNLQVNYPFRIYPAFYKEIREGDWVIFKNEYAIIDRHRGLGALIENLFASRMTFYNIEPNIIKRVAEIFNKVYLKKETLKSGEEKVFWDTPKREDHFVHALVYYLAALRRSRDIIYVEEKPPEQPLGDIIKRRRKKEWL